MLELHILIANLIGYSIHGLFHVGTALGLDGAARRGGIVAKVAYFSLLPLLGVLIGFWISSFIVDVGFRSWLTDPAAIISITTTSLVISTIMSVIFFWRERGAVAEATLALERERTQRIEREATLANLRALQAQIEPHFLFNTLANVTSLIDPDPAMAKRMLESFIRFLRASLADAQRIDHARRRGGAHRLVSRRAADPHGHAPALRGRRAARAARLHDRADAAAAGRRERDPPRPRAEGRRRRACASARAATAPTCVIEIADTGVGFAPTTRGGVGLTNLRDRLRLIYGERASLTVGENGGGGAAVAVRVPG